MEIEEIKIKIEAIEKEIRLKNDILERLIMELNEKTFNVKIGDLVTYKGEEYIISGFHGNVWPKGKKIKKDGIPSQIQTHFMDFDK